MVRNSLPEPRTATLRTLRRAALLAIASAFGLIAYSAMALADTGTATQVQMATATDIPFLPMQEEFCGTEGGAIIEEFGGLLVIIFFVGIVAAALLAGTIESLPMTGWWNQMGYSMMGKIPVAIMFVFIIFSLLTMVEGTFGLTAPSCVPVIG